MTNENLRNYFYRYHHHNNSYSYHKSTKDKKNKISISKNEYVVYKYRKSLSCYRTNIFIQDKIEKSQ